MGRSPARLRTADYPWGWSAEHLAEVLRGMDQGWASGKWWAAANPSVADDERLPGMVGTLPAGRRQPLDGARGPWPERRARYPPPAGSGGCPDAGHPPHERAVGGCRQQPLPRRAHCGAQLIEASGVDHRPWLGDADEILDAIETFLTGTSARPRTRRYATGSEALSRREREIVALTVAGESARPSRLRCSSASAPWRAISRAPTPSSACIPSPNWPGGQPSSVWLPARPDRPASRFRTSTDAGASRCP